MKMVCLMFLAISTSACAELEVEESEQSIINGQLDSGHLQVVKLYATDPGTQQIEYCTGTLVASRTIVTAAHCVFAESGQQYPTVTVEGVKRYYDAEFNTYYYDDFMMSSAGITPHPSYAPVAETGTDVAVVTLPATVSGVTPASLGGAPGRGVGITIVGFGATICSGSYPGYGQDKRWGTNTIDWVYTDRLTYSSGLGGGAGVCYGDSGGPVFIGGYTSNCLAGVTEGPANLNPSSYFATRVDGNAGVNAWIRQQTSQTIGGC